MKKVSLIISIVCTTALVFCTFLPNGSAYAAGVLRYSCSAQIYEAIEKERIEAFTRKTGIKVYVGVWSSASAVNGVLRGDSEIAASTRELYHRHKEYGYLDIPFCKDPLAVIVNRENPVTNMSEEQLQDIFHGNIDRWKELGGPDQPVLLVVPGKNTAAYKNFSRRPMHRMEILYDLMSYQSTMVIEAVRRFPWAISFIAQGAERQRGVKALKIDGLAPQDRDYPYHQVFHFVTHGKPIGAVKEFIDHALSEEGKRLIKAKGMVPISGREE